MRLEIKCFNQKGKISIGKYISVGFTFDIYWNNSTVSQFPKSNKILATTHYA